MRVTDMEIREEYPPNFAELERAFDLSEKTSVFCWGNVIYNPFKREITPDIEIHESVHKKQQGMYPEVWYYQYIHDDDFRLKQEIEAYGEQYAFAKKYVRGKLLKWVLENMATALSSSAYGNLLTYQQAHSKIRNYAKSVV